ncbi:MAG: hypothetical protein JWO69_257 [Thermoleophilia bacterium]|nr:hypothetical protein [Thermoleophilia bacterium]
MVLVLALFVVAGCGGDEAAPATDAAASDGAASASPTLVLNGKEVGADGSRAGEPGQGDTSTVARPKADETAPRRVRAVPGPPPLNDDGTITLDGDPFEGMRVPPQPVPIEDDPAATAAMARIGASMRRVEADVWNTWMRNGSGNLMTTPPVGTRTSVVKVFTERCGGAQTVTTGVVLADETVVTSVHAIESMKSRILVASGTGQDLRRLGAMVRYLDVDDDIAVLKVPGLEVAPLGMHVPAATTPTAGYAYGVGPRGAVQGVPVMVSQQEGVIDREQPDGFAERISDRSVQTLIGAITTGHAGGPVLATNDPDLVTGWGFHGLVRARVPYRTEAGGIVVPSRLVGAALDASNRGDEWFEHGPGGCPQWFR